VKLPLLTLDLRHEQDVVKARQRARELAGALGFDHQDQIRIATAISEVARNAIEYAGAGKVEFSLDSSKNVDEFIIETRDSGPGIPDLDRILSGAYTSSTGMGLGITGARRLMDGFSIDSDPGKGTRIMLSKRLALRVAPLDAKKIEAAVNSVMSGQTNDPLTELEQQNRELLSTLEQLNLRQSELVQLNKELEETNRGVVALYAEINDKADYLQRASELKSKFLSNMSHEFRTPLNSIIALSRILLDRLDGDLTREQEKQVQFIRRSADNLLELVNDLLDLAKVEAGKITVRPVHFDVGVLFGSLRSVLKPLLVSQRVDLVFEDPEGIPPLFSDESKVAQILRNFISNALKFTERGEVRVCARMIENGLVRFSVQDTGIGIAPQDQERVFEEFSQVDSPVQRTAKGTGLGLPLSRKLATILGGTATVESTPGIGSIFHLTIPMQFQEVREEETPALDAEPVSLIIDDDEVSRYLLKGLLHWANVRIVEASNGIEGLRAAHALKPSVIFLDLNIPDLNGFEILDRLKSDQNTADIPVVIYTSRILDEKERAALSRAAGILMKDATSREEQLEALEAAFERAGLDFANRNVKA